MIDKHNIIGLIPDIIVKLQQCAFDEPYPTSKHTVELIEKIRQAIMVDINDAEI